jgi:hypothetical protein
MGRKIIGYILEFFKSPVVWIIVVGALSDLGFEKSEFTSNSIQRFGLILADILSMFFK